MKLYKKKPIPVEVIQYDGINGIDIMTWSNGKVIEHTHWCNDMVMSRHLIIKTLEGNMTAPDESYIVKGPFGEFWAVKKEIFEATYEEVV